MWVWVWRCLTKLSYIVHHWCVDMYSSFVHVCVCQYVLLCSLGVLAGQLKREGKAGLLCTICQIWACLPICGVYWQVLARLNSWQREMNNWTCAKRSSVGMEWGAFIHGEGEWRQTVYKQNSHLNPDVFVFFVNKSKSCRVFDVMMWWDVIWGRGKKHRSLALTHLDQSSYNKRLVAVTDLTS